MLKLGRGHSYMRGVDPCANNGSTRVWGVLDVFKHSILLVTLYVGYTYMMGGQNSYNTTFAMLYGIYFGFVMPLLV